MVPSLDPGSIHVWRVDLDPPAEAVARLHGLLLPEEVERRDRFVFERHRRRFGVCRGTLRLLLGGYLGVDPKSVAFGEGARGKPFLSLPRARDLRFNVSHSHELALIAVAEVR